MWYVGMDVHRRRTQIAVVDEVGRELRNENVPNDAGRIAEVLSGAEPGTSVVGSPRFHGRNPRSLGSVMLPSPVTQAVR